MKLKSILRSNSNPKWVSDGVKFTSDRPFQLMYINGTAMFENNAIGSKENGGFRLDDSVVGAWETIGYDKMDGRIPACYQYSRELGACHCENYVNNP